MFLNICPLCVKEKLFQGLIAVCNKWGTDLELSKGVKQQKAPRCLWAEFTGQAEKWSQVRAKLFLDILMPFITGSPSEGENSQMNKAKRWDPF